MRIYIYCCLLLLIFNSCSKSKNIPPTCGENKFSLKTDFSTICSIYSEFGGVVSESNSSGKICSFWYSFSNDNSKRDYEIMFYSSFVVNGKGDYEFTPKESNYRTFEINSSWIEVFYDKNNTVPWDFDFTIPKKVKFTITQITDSYISGYVKVDLKNNKIFYGSFNKLVLR